jgi:hypothetical protein
MYQSFNGMSLVVRENGNTEGNGSAYKNANQALQAYNQGYAGQQHGVQMLEQLQSVSKSYPQLLETLQSSKDSEAVEMLAQYRMPAAQDLLFAFRDHGLHDWTTSLVFNHFVGKVTTTGDGMAEIFQDVWNVAYPEA